MLDKGKIALIIVDAQYDFMPGGALAVKDGDQIIPAIQKLADEVDLIVATQDWHPKDHMSFVENGGIWPVHCVQNSKGAELHLAIAKLPNEVFQKATSSDIDAYSGFANEKLSAYLKEHDVKEVIITGLATDYCVKATALDAQKAGFKTRVFIEGVRGVEEATTEVALLEMAGAGIELR